MQVIGGSVPPETARGADSDTLHGVVVADPYRWLEDTDDPSVRSWVDAQNDHTEAILSSVPSRRTWRDRIGSHLRRAVVAPGAQLRGDVVVALERREGADQAVLVRRTLDDELTGAAEVLVDPTIGGDPTAAIDWFEASPDGALVAYGTSVGGTERSVLRIVGGGPHGGEAIPDTRHCSLAWEPDGTGFFYTRYPAGAEYGRAVRHHRLGDDPDDDPIVVDAAPDSTSQHEVTLSPDGRWLIVHVYEGWARVDVRVLDRSNDTWATVIEGHDAESHFTIGPSGTSLVGVTTLGASSGRLVEVPLRSAGDGPPAWATLVPEGDAVLAGPHVAGDEIWLVASRDGVDAVVRHGGDGRRLGVLGEDGGEPVAVLSLDADRTAGAALVVVDRFGAPPSMWWGTAGAGAVSALDLEDASALRNESSELTVRHVEYPSKDGTPVGLFLVHRADVVPDASTPALLDGYGGFAISRGPKWAPETLAWCEAGGLYAVAQLRGGSERGERWHLAGRRQHKQNVFDDFAAAANWLVTEGLTSRARLAIVGRSNGGLLVGAALTQRPELCAAVWCGVPLLDMVRFPRFLIARLWTSEYGDPAVAEEFAWLHAYSPYHHVDPGTCYPATLITCAEGDSRVHPGHARKMVAALQAATSCGERRPVALIEERDAGHGVGKPVALRAAELSNAITFLGEHVGLSPT